MTSGRRNFRALLEEQWGRNNFVCVGLDTDYDKIPPSSDHGGDTVNVILSFNKRIIKATYDLVCAFKLNVAFYEAKGRGGLEALRETISYIQHVIVDVPVILDFKRADIGNTNLGYVEMAFREMNADAVTVHPYLGAEALRPFLDWTDKGIFVLCRTSNNGAGEFQDLNVIGSEVPEGKNMPLYQYVAHRVVHKWNKRLNCGLVVGATYPEELQQVREIAPEMPILIPGIGAQGGDVEKTVRAGKDGRNAGMIINSSRGIIFASNGADFAEAARNETLKLRELINQYR